MTTGTGSPDSNETTPAVVSPDKSTTTPGIEDAISAIGEYEYESPVPTEEHGETETKIEPKNDDEALAFIMFGQSHQTNTMVLPTITTEEWTHSGEKPTPMNTSKARKLLAKAFADVPCGIAGAGMHGHAWMIEHKDVWAQRKGVTATVDEPAMPIRTGYGLKEVMEHADKEKQFLTYHHLCKEGRNLLIQWYGKAMYVDMDDKGIDNPATTPRQMIEHLEKVYCTSRDFRRHAELVDESFNAPYNRKGHVEEYFMKIQEAREDALALGQPYTIMQTMNKVISRFEMQHKDCYKAEEKWNVKRDANKWTDDETWKEFKTFWKEQIHRWDTRKEPGKEANAAEVDAITNRMSVMEANLSALQTKNHNYQTENQSLRSQQLEMQHALQAGLRDSYSHQGSSSKTDSDDISALTDIISELRQEVRCLKVPKDDATMSATGTAGEGQVYKFYCWRCGCNLTHWTRKCRFLGAEEKRKYRQANCKNPMGGSTKYVDRLGMKVSDVPSN